MIPVRIEDVDRAALHALIDNAVAEGRTIEYKQALPGKANSEVDPVVATVTSFANTDGGDLLLGVKASKSAPLELPGIEIENWDREKLRLEHMLLNRVKPRLPRGAVTIRAIETTNGRHVVVIRVTASWTGPHQVSPTSKFYGRTSGGRYEFDVEELRRAFAMSETITDRIREFRRERIARIESRQTPVPLVKTGFMVVHVIPLSAVRATTGIDMADLNAFTNQMRPMETSGGWSNRINLDGLVTCTRRPPDLSYAYTQMFRTGAAEGVLTLHNDDESRVALTSDTFEYETADFVTRYLTVAENLEIEPPFYAFLSFVGVQGCRLALHRGIPWPGQEVELPDDVMRLPEVVIQDRNEQVFKVLKPAFDMVWNAFGWLGSRNYDKEGEWARQ